MKFEWDERKAHCNETKHRVSFELATHVFRDPKLVLAEDASHSGAEPRYLAFGRVGAGVLTVRFTVRRATSDHRCRVLEKRVRHSMRKRIVYTDEPIKIGRRVGRDVLVGHGGPREGAGRPATGNMPVTLRLPPKLLETVRRDAKRAGKTMSAYVAAKLRGHGS